MDPDAFLDALEADHETALSRLGSSKALYAVTAGEMDAPAVLAALAARARTAAGTFDAWAADADDGDEVVGARATFADAAADQREAADRLDDLVEEAAEAAPDVPDPGPLFDHLAGLEGTVERAAGLAAWALVADATRAQAVGFFVGSADEATADALRALREDVGDARAAALALLDDAGDDGADRERALEAAGGTIDAAYGGYVDALEALGISVKPIC